MNYGVFQWNLVYFGVYTDRFFQGCVMVRVWVIG